MLLGPQGFEKVGDPAVDRAEAMEPRVAGPAEGDQGVRAVGGAAVVDDQGRGGLADAAEVAVAGQGPFPAPAEAGPRAPSAVVAEFTESATIEVPRSAGAAERELLVFEVGGHESAAGVFLERRQALPRVGRGAKNPSIRRRRRPGIHLR